MEEVEQSLSILVEARITSPRNPRTIDEGQKDIYGCMRCGHEWQTFYKVDKERICLHCRSIGIRFLRV